MKVLGIPVSNRNLGSSRLRYYYMLENLPSGWEFERYSPGAQGNILYIQKCETKEVWNAINDCRARGIPIVYERDDFCKPWNPEHTKIMNAADAVTVITESQVKSIQKYTITPVYYIFDGFDYNIKREDRVVLRNKMSRIVTYGRHANIEESEKYLCNSGLTPYYLCDRPAIKNAKYIKWNLQKFKNKLHSFDIVLIVHANNYRRKHKDAGRAIVAMAMGLPAIVTPCIEHEQIYKEAGYPWMVVYNKKQIRSIVDKLKPLEMRREISDAFYEYVWQCRRPELASAEMAELFKKVINEKKNMD